MTWSFLRFLIEFDREPMILSIVVFAGLFVVGLFGVMVYFLLVFHSYLAVSNKTTWEYLSWGRIPYLQIWPKQLGSPFSLGCRWNIYYFCFKSLVSVTTWSMPSEIPDISNEVP